MDLTKLEILIPVIILNVIVCTFAIVVFGQIIFHIVKAVVVYVYNSFKFGFVNYYHIVSRRHIHRMNEQGIYVKRQVSDYGILPPYPFNEMEDHLREIRHW
tara:strand:+ start:1074 stop:1376 length:303 start_codon:yes stop_codon:yes gene_type:complete